MSSLVQITLQDGHPRSLARLDESGKVLQKAQTVWGVAEFCRQARKSRRQLYRDIRHGKIKPLGKFLGEWLLDPSELVKLHPLPPSLASLLPEYDLGSLDPWGSADLLLARILRFGGRDRLRWAFSFYGEARIKRFIMEKGMRQLDPRSSGFWSCYFHLEPWRAAAATQKGRQWGGA